MNDDHTKTPELDDVDLAAVMEKFDRESSFRKLKGVQLKIVSIIAILFSFFQLYTGAFGVLPSQLQRSIHLTFVLVLGYLLYPSLKNMPRDRFHWFDVTLACLGAFVGLYWVYNYNALMYRAGSHTTMDFIVGGIAILLVLEGARRVVGVPIAVIASVCILYAKFGAYMPGFLNHRGYSVERIISHMYYTTEGIIGIPLGVAATFIFLFVLFGSFLEKTGISKFFIDLANSLAGWASGGPAKVAVLTSALQGTVSGSSVANTVCTGSFTIPLMKKLGYKPEFAAAVEAAASTGGQIMPPIMGAAAFLMAEFIGIPYVQIIKAGAIPALLYFTGIWIVVHLEAKKEGMKGLSRDELPRFKDVAMKQGYMILPLVAIIFFLVSGATPIKAAMYGLGLTIVTSFISKATRMNLKGFLEALESGARTALGVSMACACAGMIVGTITLTGLGLKIGNGLIGLSGGNLLLTLFFTMITSLILGMGAPTTANYIITATIAAPALVLLGVPVLAAHMFTFYFGIIADITPPVALAAFAGSAIAKSDPIKTAFNASKLAIAAYIIPYMFVLNPAILMIDTNAVEIVMIIFTAIIGMIGIGAAMEGYLLTHATWPERGIFLIAGLMMVYPGAMTDLVGLGLMAVGFIIQKMRVTKLRSA